LINDFENKVRISHVVGDQQPQPIYMNMASKKGMYWMNAKDGLGMTHFNDKRSKGSEPEMKGAGVTQIVWNPSLERSHQFVTVDDAASLKLWDSKSKTLMAEEARVTKGTLQCCAINNAGNNIACGDLHGKIHVFQLTTINKKMKKNDSTIKLLQKK
jgi:hypothetical protein